jgi:hypothetical protein
MRTLGVSCRPPTQSQQQRVWGWVVEWGGLAGCFAAQHRPVAGSEASFATRQPQHQPGGPTSIKPAAKAAARRSELGWQQPGIVDAPLGSIRIH